ncbi:hypothetical protein GCM10007881_08350 [Mesorhizobium huakuii]|uniref:COG3904 family protein n=1 Tax=Mesorhizobium huakuii TaxID=28104 RepID=UPI00235D8490|nr:hypothetical protein [Mesorhizobium huakuii]GLQ77319.1 hypothetical protein GCM10007881_08350 [Mesorhizobium huakuii]
MRSVVKFLAVASVIVAAASSAKALEYKPVSSPGELPFLIVSGEFGVNERLDEFSRAVTSSGARVVVFDSPGGSIGSAMQLGRMIRAAGLDTLQVRQLQCASACSLAFMGGVRRVADPGSIGVHRSSFAPESGMSTDEAVANVQAVTAEIMSYMAEMGVDPKLMAVALSYDRSDMRYLSASEMGELRVTNISTTPPSIDTSRVSPTPSPTPAEASADERQLESAAVAFIKGLIEHHGDNADLAIAQVQNSYAGIVDYYGKPTDLSSIIADKRSYFQRWPERGYNLHDESVIVTCANDQCMVSGTYDWVVRSLPRHKQAKGVARFSYTIAIGQNPKIIAETSKVMR